jgi:hypothetical protein
VAGFDFEFTYTEAQKPVVLVCLAAGRARARRLRLSWRWRHVRPRHCVVVVDGNSRVIDLLGYRLERDLPLVAEGCVIAESLSSTQRSRIGRGFVDMMLRGRDANQDSCMVLRGVAETRYYYPPYDYDCPSLPRLHARLSITEELLVAWNFNEIAPEVLLEELHTACELVLEELVNQRSERLSFAELVANADEAGLLRHSHDDTPPVRLLTDLKDLRKDVRHRAAEGARQWLNEQWQDVAICLERLVFHANHKNR